MLIHLNLRQSVSPPPPEESRRVQFIGTTGMEEELPPPSYDQLVQDSDRSNTGTLGEWVWSPKGSVCTCMHIDAGRQLLRSVGGFFGLTEVSQRGGGEEIGWQEFTERNFEVSLLGTMGCVD